MNINYSSELNLKEYFTTKNEALVVNINEEDIIYLLNKVSEFNRDRICKLSLRPHIEENNIYCLIKLDIIDELFDNTYLVKKGIRSCYSTMIDLDLLDIIKKFTSMENLYVFPSNSDIDDSSVIIFIYKEPHMQILFNMIDREEDEVLRQTLLGQVLGYKDMEEYLTHMGEEYKREIGEDIEFVFEDKNYPNYFNFVGNVTHNNISDKFIFFKGK